jgi:hypothetical protein
VAWATNVLWFEHVNLLSSENAVTFEPLVRNETACRSEVFPEYEPPAAARAGVTPRERPTAMARVARRFMT